jgi:hypothetical protein
VNYFQIVILNCNLALKILCFKTHPFLAAA